MMDMPLGSLFAKLGYRRSLRYWEDQAEAAAAMELEPLKALRGQARQLRRRIDRLTHVADGRLSLPLITSNAIRRHAQSDWAWRPELWSGPVSPPGIAAAANRSQYGAEATIFHDCAESEVTLRQVRNTRPEDLAPFALRIDVFAFSGSFLSLVIDLPTDARDGLSRNHIVRADLALEFEAPIEVFARLNVKHGPNSEQVVRELSGSNGAVAAEFDLGRTSINEKRIEKMWLDLILEGPRMNQVTLRDLTMTRRPRAAF